MFVEPLATRPLAGADLAARPSLSARSLRLLLFVVGPMLVAPLGCGPHPPAHWAQGGSPVGPVQARWTAPDQVVDIAPDGRVMVDGDWWFSVDAAGRIFDRDGDPLALLEPDGRLVGVDERPLGQIGMHNSSLPGRPTAWLALGDQGDVTRFDDEGARHPQGAWAGCGANLRTCTLVSHFTLVLAEARRPRVGIGLGIGVGVGFGR